MTRDEMRTALQAELGAILDEDDLTLLDSMTAADVPGWDSLAHLKLLVALESKLGIKFQLSEMTTTVDVGELLDLMAAKLAARI